MPAATSAILVNQSSALSPRSAQQHSARKSSASKKKATPEEPENGAAQAPAQGTASTAGTGPKRQHGAQRQLPSDPGGKVSAALSACLLSADRNDGPTQQPGAQSGGRDAHCSRGSAPAEAVEGTGNAGGQGPGRTGDAGGEGFGDDYWVPDSYPVASGSVQAAVHAVPPDEAVPNLALHGSEATPLKEVPQLGEGPPAAEQGGSKGSASGGRARSAAYMQRRISALGKSARKPEAPAQQLRVRISAPAGKAEASRTTKRMRKGAADGAAQASDAVQGSMRASAAEGAVGSRAGAGAAGMAAPEERRAAVVVQDGATAEGVQPAGRAAGHKWVSAWVTEVATTLAAPGAAALAADEVEMDGAAAAPVQGEGARLANGQLPDGNRAARKSRLQALMAKTQRKEGGAGKGRSRVVHGQAQRQARTGGRAQRAERAQHIGGDAAADDRSCDAGCGPAAAAEAQAAQAVATNNAVQHASVARGLLAWQNVFSSTSAVFYRHAKQSICHNLEDSKFNLHAWCRRHP